MVTDTSMFRRFTIQEQAFLAWAFVRMVKMTPSQRYDTDPRKLQQEWTDMTGELLPDDFGSFVYEVFEAQ